MKISTTNMMTITDVHANAEAIQAKLTLMLGKYPEIPSDRREDLAQNAFVRLLQKFNTYEEVKQTFIFELVRNIVAEYSRRWMAQCRDVTRVTSLSGDDRNDGEAMDVEQCFTIAHSCDPWNGTPVQVAISREYRDIARKQFKRLSSDEQDALNARWQGVALNAKLGMRAKRAESKLKKMLTA